MNENALVAKKPDYPLHMAVSELDWPEVWPFVTIELLTEAWVRAMHSDNTKGAKGQNLVDLAQWWVAGAVIGLSHDLIALGTPNSSDPMKIVAWDEGWRWGVEHLSNRLEEKELKKKIEAK